MAVDQDTILRTSSNVLIRRIEDRLLVLHLDSERYFGLDEVGARVWDLLQRSPTTPTSLARTLMAEFDVDEPTIVADLDTLLGSMLDRGLVEVG